jgi:hypothetical protein
VLQDKLLFDQQYSHNDQNQSISTLMMLLILEVPMFMMALLLAICGYVTIYDSLEEDPFSYPTGTLNEYCDGLEFAVDGYFAYYVMACVRIVLSFGLWIAHGRRLYHQVSLSSSSSSSKDDAAGDEKERQENEWPVYYYYYYYYYASTTVSLVIVLLSGISLFTILHPAVQDLRDIDPSG